MTLYDFITITLEGCVYNYFIYIYIYLYHIIYIYIYVFTYICKTPKWPLDSWRRTTCTHSTFHPGLVRAIRPPHVVARKPPPKQQERRISRKNVVTNQHPYTRSQGSWETTHVWRKHTTHAKGGDEVHQVFVCFNDLSRFMPSLPKFAVVFFVGKTLVFLLQAKCWTATPGSFRIASEW